MHAPKGRQAAAATRDTEIEGVGTKLSGLATADNAPFRCGNCKWFTLRQGSVSPSEVEGSFNSPESGEGECGHPVVLVDPEAADRLTGNGTVRVDEDECCNFFRPGGQKESPEYEKAVHTRTGGGGPYH